jgi:hypothetical protein
LWPLAGQRCGIDRAAERRTAMKMSSISGVVCYVRDLDATAAFYEKLGFRTYSA